MTLTNLLYFLMLFKRTKTLLSPNTNLVKIPSTAAKFKCHICNKNTTVPFELWDFDKSISSDCKLIKSKPTIGNCLYCKSTVKKTSTTWKNEVSKIYNNYSIYSDSGGSEKVVFDSNQKTQKPRSEVIIETLINKVKLPHNMKILDIGTGYGETSVFLAKQFKDKIVITCEKYIDGNLILLKNIENKKAPKMADALTFFLLIVINALERLKITKPNNPKNKKNVKKLLSEKEMKSP